MLSGGRKGVGGTVVVAGISSDGSGRVGGS